MEESLQTLATLDNLLLTLREELDTLESRSTTERSSKVGTTDEAPLRERLPVSKQHNYSTIRDSLDLAKARRVIHARASAVESVKTLIAKYRDG